MECPKFSTTGLSYICHSSTCLHYLIFLLKCTIRWHYAGEGQKMADPRSQLLPSLRGLAVRWPSLPSAITSGTQQGGGQHPGGCSPLHGGRQHIKTLYTVRFGTAEVMAIQYREIGYSISGQFCPCCPIWGSTFCWLYRKIRCMGIGYIEVRV